MAAAKYLVTQPPGAPTPVGFVNIGQIFTAPDDYVPSLTFRPVNQEALKVLEKVFADRKLELERRLARAEKMKRIEDHETLTSQIDDLEIQRKKNLRIFTPEEKEKAIEPGVSLKELAELEEKTRASIGGKVDPGEAKGGSVTKGDRKL